MAKPRIYVYLSIEEAETVAAEAKARDLSTSEYCRQIIEGRHTREAQATQTPPSNVAASDIKLDDGHNLNDYMGAILKALKNINVSQQKVISSQNNVVATQKNSIDEFYNFLDYVNDYAHVHDQEAAEAAYEGWRQKHENP